MLALHALSNNQAILMGFFNVTNLIILWVSISTENSFCQ